MTDDDLRVTIGALLHDIGKVIYRSGDDGRKHGQSGYDFLKEEIGIDDRDVLDCVRYHHAGAIRGATIDDNSPAYIVYMADNIASSVDRRKTDVEESGFEIHTPLRPVFNILNGAKSDLFYSTKDLEIEKTINYPTKEKQVFTADQYQKIIRNISDNLKGIEWNGEYLNSLLEVMEGNLVYVPSSTSKGEIPDISLFDHLKITAAISICISRYFKDAGITDYRDVLLEKGADFYSVKAFRIASLDVSGIQKFIYTINSKNALRTLRARSFYLEIMMEHITDLLLERLELSRANLIYLGGGHCYLIIPNTESAKLSFTGFVSEINQWFIDNYDISLFIAGGTAGCSAESLKNIPAGSYEEIFRRLSKNLSESKLHRYSAGQIVGLNNKEAGDYSRECAVCRRIGEVNEEGRCRICSAMERLSSKVLYSEFFSVMTGDKEDCLPLPGGYYLDADNNEESIRSRMTADDGFVRAYGKNRAYTGRHIATRLWVGDYTTGKTFEEYAEEACGIDRIGILRADVDNLGQAFVSGFKDESNNDRYVTISRTATLSRQLSMFFKLHINKILANAEFSLDGKTGNKRNASIVYSGGDDVFIVGAWNDIIELAVDIRDSFNRFTNGTLTISAGIGLYDSSYPISASSHEVEKMVDRSKEITGKAGITLLEDGEYHINPNGESVSDGTYKWNELKEKVICEKYALISKYLDLAKGISGNSFLYHLLELIRQKNERINFARYVYLLARMEPENGSQEQKDGYKRFSKSMIDWIESDSDSRELKTAIELYVYLHRETEEKHDTN